VSRVLGRNMRMAPAGAGGGRDAPAGADRQGRSRSVAGPPPRWGPNLHVDWGATPQAKPSHL